MSKTTLHDTEEVIIQIDDKYHCLEIVTDAILGVTGNRVYFVPSHYVPFIEWYLADKYFWNKRLKRDIEKNILPILEKKSFWNKIHKLAEEYNH